MYVFDATNPYHRYMMHYESEHQLSIPEIIARGSVDARTAATIWYLLEHRASIIVAGPTDPTPGVGKTTTLNALLPFYPAGTGFVYTVGMYENFDFLNETTPHETTVLANEVSDHLRIYMWGKPARRLIRLPERGYAIATTCHADTLRDVLAMFTNDLRIAPHDIQRIQLVVNIGIKRYPLPAKRRWLTTHFIVPDPALQDAAGDLSGHLILPAGISAPVTTQLVSAWDNRADSFVAPDSTVTAAMAAWSGVTHDEFCAAIDKRTAFLRDLAADKADYDATSLAVQQFRDSED
jgi:hypothetical protein